VTQRPVIAGIGMTRFGKHPDKSLRDLAGEAVTAALTDAGLTAEDLDCAFASNSVAGIITGQEAVRGQVSMKDLDLGGIPVFNVENACASGSTAIHLATSYLAGGAAEIALVVGYEKMVHPDKAVSFRALETCSDIEEMEQVKARLGPEAAKRSVFMDLYAEKVQAYLDKTGATQRHLAQIAAKNSENGTRNPLAQFQTANDTDTVLNSRPIVAPLTLLMCAGMSDGAAALVLMTPGAAKARQIDGPVIAGSAIRSESFETGGSQMRRVAQLAYDQAGLTPADMDLAEVHDATSPGELFAYEDIGLAEYGEGWKRIDDGSVFAGGRCPVNPSGGLLSRGHPIGATGVAQVCELALHLRGDAGERQVKGAKSGIAHCLGGQASFGNTSGAAAMAATILTA
jgi:acetyl-CoA acetyltransferase